MERKEIIENNKKIAVFMGYTYYPWNKLEVKNKYDAGWKKSIEASPFSKFNKHKGLGEDAYLCRTHAGLKYQSDWGWIMPCYVRCLLVIKELWNIKTNDQLKLRECTLSLTNLTIIANDEASMKSDVYNAVLKFVNWYNQEKN